MEKTSRKRNQRSPEQNSPEERSNRRIKLYSDTYDDSSKIHPDLFNFSTEQRIKFYQKCREYVDLEEISRRDFIIDMYGMLNEDKLLTAHEFTINPYGWPKEYLEIYIKERKIRNPREFDHCIQIDKKFIHQPKGLQAKIKHRIENMSNINCIKSRHTLYYDVEDIYFGDEIIELLRNAGINYFTSYIDYINSFNDAEDRFEEWEKLVKSYPNKYQIIVEYINMKLGEYAKYVCIAGGFALSKWMYETYGQTPNFSDIDLFIHSCDDKIANKICQLLETITGKNVYENDNVLSSFFENIDIEYDNYGDSSGIKFNNMNISIQIIKRLYQSPAEVILGFDVDSCCILTTLDNKTYVTERGYYSLKTGYNVMNFDRMSPSYEYRLAKYNKRGFAIWIPYIEYFKHVTSFDSSKIKHNVASSIIIKSLISHITKTYDFQIDENIEISDYETKKKSLENYGGEYVQFKVLNPGEQIINTFHRIVLDDVLNWYPNRDENLYEMININDKSMEITKITEPVNIHNLVSARNIIRTKKSNIHPTLACVNSCKESVNFIYSLLPDCILSGGIVRGAISGISSFDINVFSDSIKTIEDQKRLSFELIKFTTLLKVKNSVISVLKNTSIDTSKLIDRNVNDFGRIIFKRSYEDVINPNIGEEENFKNFCINNFDFKVVEILTEDYNKHLFIPSELLLEYINLYSHTDGFKNKIGFYGEGEELFNNLKVRSKYLSTEFMMKYENEIYNRIIENPVLNNLSDTESLLREFPYISDEINRYINNHKKLSRETVISFIFSGLIASQIIENRYPKYIQYRAFLSIFYRDIIRVNIKFPLSITTDYVQEGIFFKDGNYFTTEYDKFLLMMGTTHDEVSSGDIKFLNYYAWENYIPK